jgi:CheY-like chemotaxis protein
MLPLLRFRSILSAVERSLLKPAYPANRAGEGAGKMALILLVDDDEVARHIVRRMLERAGHRIEEAGDGEAALAALEGGTLPDCMVLDLMMPRMGGVDVLRRVRSDARWQNVPVVLMTALDQGTEVEAARQMGFRRHFLKAYWHAGDLINAINHSVPSTTPAAATSAPVGTTATTVPTAIAN